METFKVQAREGSPARHVDSSCEAGNKKSTRWMDKVMKTDRQPGLWTACARLATKRHLTGI